MTSGPVMLTCLERDNAIAYLREVIGATDPSQAAAGNRSAALYAQSKQFELRSTRPTASRAPIAR